MIFCKLDFGTVPTVTCFLVFLFDHYSQHPRSSNYSDFTYKIYIILCDKYFLPLLVTSSLNVYNTTPGTIAQVKMNILIITYALFS